MRRASTVALAALSLSGCQRGCLTEWLRERSGEGRGGTAAQSLPLDRFDCPDGWLRCHGGVAEASMLGSVAANCAATPDHPAACECPYRAVARCLRGCAAEDVIVEGAPDEASRTCNGGGAAALAVPAPVDAGPAACAGEIARFRCEHAIVFACAAAGAVAVSECVSGCYREGEELDDPAVDVRGATALLCRAIRPTLEP